MIDEEPEIIKLEPAEDQHLDTDGKPLPNRRVIPDRRVNSARLQLKNRKSVRRKSDREIEDFIDDNG